MDPSICSSRHWACLQLVVSLFRMEVGHKRPCCERCMWHRPSPSPVSSLKSKGKYASVSFKLLQDMGGVISLAIYTGTVPHVSFQKFAVAFYFVRCNGFCFKQRHARGQRHVLSHRVCWTPGIAKVDVAAGFRNNVFTTISSDKRSKITPGLFICIQQLSYNLFKNIQDTNTETHVCIYD